MQLKVATIFAGLSATTIAISLPTQDNVLYPPFCSDIDLSHPHLNASEPINCIERFGSVKSQSSPPFELWKASNHTRISGESKGSIICLIGEDQDTPRHTNETTNSIRSRFPKKGSKQSCRTPAPYRSDFLPGSNNNQRKWCFREGPIPTPKDLSALSMLARDKFDDTWKFRRIWQIQRTKWANKQVMSKSDSDNDGTCFCTMLRVRTAGLKICNCDRCDAMVLNMGMHDLVGTLQHECMNEGFASGYVKMRDPNGLFVVHGFPGKEGMVNEPVELDPVLNAPGVLTGTCISNNEFRRKQDDTYKVLECKWKDWYAGRCATRVKYGANGKITIEH
ncbi:hypothetical protein ONS95_003578 [Cadophora gregata]|uniref:uncharacterized protein n=1 Tax=Cadophora gregata TaxID=51156 RepID=UPI0026DCB173|nr:uncharacterized protein ONS95_003578 [Cadophora gregata]KAK0099349.1 hypothetical protein ONS96_008379 [Cadophora gregata f. sp. sojae]KAK0106856.1 hypothetical protein ONS95_003578 [Cadophora gregata]